MNELYSIFQGKTPGITFLYCTILGPQSNGTIPRRIMNPGIFEYRNVFHDKMTGCSLCCKQKGAFDRIFVLSKKGIICYPCFFDVLDNLIFKKFMLFRTVVECLDNDICNEVIKTLHHFSLHQVVGKIRFTIETGSANDTIIFDTKTQDREYADALKPLYSELNKIIELPLPTGFFSGYTDKVYKSVFVWGDHMLQLWFEPYFEIDEIKVVIKKNSTIHCTSVREALLTVLEHLNKQ